MNFLSVIIQISFACACLVQTHHLKFCHGLEDRNNAIPAFYGLGSNSSVSFIAKLRGLPWSVNVDQIVEFFDECNIINGTKGVHLIKTKEGRPSGVAYVEMETEDDLEAAYKKDGKYLGERYIEVFQASRSEMLRTLRRSEQSIQRALSDACVRIRGLPYKTTEEDVINFFAGLDVLPNGVSLVYDDKGRTTGEAYVQFRDQKEAERALQRDKGRFYHRYIEVFRSSLGELRLAHLKQLHANRVASEQQQTAYGRGPNLNQYDGYQILRPLRFSGYPERYHGGEWNRGGNPWYKQNELRQPDPGVKFNQQNMEAGNCKFYALHMRGLPFDTTRKDILEFFSPLVPVQIDIHYNSKGKATGQADVLFKTQEELEEAMTRNNNYLGHRYIELFQ